MLAAVLEKLIALDGLPDLSSLFRHSSFLCADINKQSSERKKERKKDGSINDGPQ